MTLRSLVPALLLASAVGCCNCGCTDREARRAAAAADVAAEVAAADAPSLSELGPALSQAASMPNETWEIVSQSVSAPTLGEIRDEASLTAVLIVLKPEELPEGSGFRFTSGEHATPYEAAPHLERSKDKGYVSVLQPEDVTSYACEVEGDEARGQVAWTTADAWTGTADFVARRDGEAWQIVEFKVPGQFTTRRVGDTWQVTELGGEEPTLVPPRR
ncbi:MAG: hypothetical protein R3F62_08050 [Planctomycetota bacterium]